jgi:cytochrome c-type biogenesis protein CcmH
MTLWLILGAMSAAVVAGLLLGLRRGAAPPSARADHDLEVYRAQLRELERDVKRGVLGETELRSSRLEIERRMLAADAARESTPTSASGRKTRALPLIAALLVPAGAFALYLWLGDPGVESVPFTARPSPPPVTAEAPPPSLPDVETMMAGLRARLAENPEDLQGWIMLARSAGALGDYGAAVEAYGHALALEPDLPSVHSALGEARVMAAEGVVTEAAERNFEAALADDPQDPRARFYMALAREQDGDLQGALDALVALLADAPADATWTEGVREGAVGLAKALGLDPGSVLPPPDAVASEEQAERLAARLNDNPKDYQGWITLARMRAALGDPDGARAALDNGSAAYASAPFVQQQFQQTAAELGLEAPASGTRGPSADDMRAAADMTPEEQQAMIRSMVAGLAERLEGSPDDVEGWRMLARSYGVLGEHAKAAEAYGRVTALSPDDSQAQLDYAGALIETAGTGDPAPPEAVAILEKVIAADPQNPDALYYLGDAAQRRGDGTGAALYWQRLLVQLPADSEDYAWLKARIDALAPAE